jgi:hypothetical protein
MKKFITTITALFIAVFVMAQVPNTINYQAVARNNSGQALANQNIKVRLSILRGPTSLYSETRTVTTNALGLFNVQIGSSGATTTSGDFSSIYWLNNTPGITLKVELDVNNSGVFTEMGNQTLATVPFAFAAKTAIDAVNLGGRYVDDATVPNHGDVMRWNSNANAWKPAAVTGAPYYDRITTNTGTQILPTGNNFVFYGNPRLYTVPQGKVVTVFLNASAVVGQTNVPSLTLGFVACYQKFINGTWGPVTPFYTPAFFQETRLINGTRDVISTSCFDVLQGGDYRIGFGVRNNTSATVNDCESMLGYLQIFDNN